MIGFGEFGGPPRCSKNQCRAAAEWNLNWRNPKIHDVDRVKVWAACEAHRDELHDWLASRAFPVAITPFGVQLERIEAS